jgi:hypothetical protein
LSKNSIIKQIKNQKIKKKKVRKERTKKNEHAIGLENELHPNFAALLTANKQGVLLKAKANFLKTHKEK